MIGKTILHYKILEKLGEGGMGVVYKAEDTKLKRDVAIKFLPRHISSNEEERKRFETEAQAAASLNHPNLSTIHSIEEADDNVFIVMEYIDGIELKDKIKTRPVPIDEAIHIAEKIAEGLKAAHKKGIIHRDIKSQNIMITEEDEVKIMDFGLAKIKGGAQLTKAGSTFGTIAYMSPEQIKGEEVDQRADIWSFGIVFYEMLTGRLPFKGDYDQAVMYSILNDDPEPIPGIQNDISARLEIIIFKALSKNPANRYQSISELQSELKLINKSDKPEGAKSKTGSLKKKNYLIYGLTLLSIIIFISLLWNSFDTDSIDDKIPEVKRLAIIPFTNIRNDPETNFLGFALADQIIGSLAYASNILVRPSSAVRQYENKNIDPASAGNKLNVDFILTGSYLKEAGFVRLNLELIDIHSNQLIWREDFDVKYENTFRLQEIVSEKVTNNLKIKFKADKEISDTPQNPLAYEYYLRAISYSYSNQDSRLSISMIEKSLELDSTYAPAYSEMGFRYNILAQYDAEKANMWEKARSNYKKALHLNSKLLSALSNLAAHYVENGKSVEAVRLIKKALNINPNNAEAHFWLGYIYRYTGPLDKAIQEMETAVKIDPANPRFRSIGVTYFYLKKFEESLKGLDLDKGSTFSEAWKGLVYFRLNKKDLAKEQLKKAIVIEPDGTIGIWAKAFLCFLDGKREEGLEAIHLLEASGRHDAEQFYNFSILYGIYGEKEDCFRVLQKALKQGFYNYQLIENDPFFDSIRDDKRFKELLRFAKMRHEEFINNLKAESLL